MEAPLDIVGYINNRDHEVLSNKWEAPKRYAKDHLMRDWTSNGKFSELSRELDRNARVLYRAANIAWSTRLNPDIFSPVIRLDTLKVSPYYFGCEPEEVQRFVVNMVADYFNSDAVEDLVRAIARYGYTVKTTQDYYDLGGKVCVSYADQAFIDRGDKVVYVDKDNRKHLTGALTAVFYIEDTDLTKVARLGDVGLFAVTNYPNFDIENHLFSRIVEQLVAPAYLRHGVASYFLGHRGLKDFYNGFVVDKNL